METQQSRWSQDNCGTDQPAGTQGKSAQTSDDTIRCAEVGSSLTATIEDQELMSDQHRFANDGTKPARPCQSDYRHGQMYEENKEIAHLRIVTKAARDDEFRPNLAIRHSQVPGGQGFGAGYLDE